MALINESIAKAEGQGSTAIVGNENLVQQIKIETQNVYSDQNIPIHFDPDDLLDIITNFSDFIINQNEDDFGKDFKVITIEEKNSINLVSDDYYEDCIKESSPYFLDINALLIDIKNKKLKSAYYSCVSSIKRHINAFHKNSLDFDIVLENIKHSFITNLPHELKKKVRITSIVVDFMYCNCDIGKKERK